MPIDPAALNALTAQWAALKAEMDDSENRSKINYNTALEDLRRKNLTNAGNLSVRMADRGLTHSGIAAQEGISLQDDLNRQNAIRTQQHQLALATIARKRLEADANYNAQRALLNVPQQ